MTPIPETHIAEAANQLVVAAGKTIANLTAQQEVLCRIMAKVVARVPGLAAPASHVARTHKPSSKTRKTNKPV